MSDRFGAPKVTGLNGVLPDDWTINCAVEGRKTPRSLRPSPSKSSLASGSLSTIVTTAVLRAPTTAPLLGLLRLKLSSRGAADLTGVQDRDREGLARVGGGEIQRPLVAW